MRLERKFKFTVAPATELQLWFLKVLCRKTTLADNCYSPSRLSSTQEDGDGHNPSSLVIPPTATLSSNGENVYRLQFMAKHLSLKLFQITAPGTIDQEKAARKDWHRHSKVAALDALLGEAKRRTRRSLPRVSRWP